MPSSAGSVRSLLKLITKPSKIASALDWKKVSGGSILSLDIHRDRIGIAVASHPGFANSSFSEFSSGGGSDCQTLEPIRLRLSPPSINDEEEKDEKTVVTGKQKQQQRYAYNPHLIFTPSLKHECRDRLLEICETHKVCGVVVAWPLQKDTGKMGAACGRVLYTLEGLFSPDRTTTTGNDDDGLYNDSLEEVESFASNLPPLCLWDPQHFQELQRQSPPKDPEQVIDAFGRCPAYGKPHGDMKDSIHSAQQEQYNHDESIVAAQVWEDFCRVHWPDLCDEDYNDDYDEQESWMMSNEEPAAMSKSESSLLSSSPRRRSGGGGGATSLVSARSTKKTLYPTRRPGRANATWGNSNRTSSSSGNEEDLDTAHLVSW